jgi:hypothetical protein
MDAVLPCFTIFHPDFLYPAKTRGSTEKQKQMLGTIKWSDWIVYDILRHSDCICPQKVFPEPIPQIACGIAPVPFWLEITRFLDNVSILLYCNVSWLQTQIVPWCNMVSWLPPLPDFLSCQILKILIPVGSTRSSNPIAVINFGYIITPPKVLQSLQVTLW